MPADLTPAGPPPDAATTSGPDAAGAGAAAGPDATSGPDAGGSLRVLLAEDAALTRAGLEALLRAAGHRVDTVGDADALLVRVRDGYDVVVTDVRMPPGYSDEGLRAALALRRLAPPVPVLLLSAYVEPEYAAELLDHAGGGVGYLLKDRVARVADFLDAVSQVAAGGTVLDPELSRRLLRRRTDRLARLTPRERDVLRLMAEGRTNAAIGRELVIGQPAVEKHIGNVFAKLELPPDQDNHRRVLAVLTWLKS